MMGNLILRVPVVIGFSFTHLCVFFLLVLPFQIPLWSLLGCISINWALTFHHVKLKSVTMLNMVVYICFFHSAAEQHNAFLISLHSRLMN